MEQLNKMIIVTITFRNSTVFVYVTVSVTSLAREINVLTIIIVTSTISLHAARHIHLISQALHAKIGISAYNYVCSCPPSTISLTMVSYLSHTQQPRSDI